MASLSNKTILVVDLSGTFTFIAERLAKDFGRVKYFSHWMTGFSQSKDFLPGLGLPDVERIADIYDVYDNIDMAMFTDVGWGGLQERMRIDGIPVFGSGYAQELEIDRLKLKECLINAGMPTATSRLIRGIDNLRKLLAKEKDLYVKFSFFRGDGETYHHKEWFSTATWLDALSLQLGPYGKEAEFIVEEPIEGDAAEVGYDTFAVKGELPENMFWGYEVKDAGFIGTTDPLPDRLLANAEQFSSVLQKYNYTGILSTEVRVTPDKDYLIDFTARCPSPPSEIECAITENFSDIVWEGAHGRLVEPVFAAKYGAMAVLKSDWIVEHPLAIKLNDSDRVYVHGHFRVDGKDYAVVPEEFAEFGGAVGIGDTVESAIESAYDAAESISGYQVRYDGDSFNEAIETIRNGEKLGINWHPRMKAA